METQKHTIKVSDSHLMVIKALRNKNGTYNCYRSTLERIFTTLLYQSEELGMSDNELIATLRVIDSIRRDLAVIAGPAALAAEASGNDDDDTIRTEIAEKVDAMFPADLLDLSAAIHQETPSTENEILSAQ